MKLAALLVLLLQLSAAAQQRPGVQGVILGAGPETPVPLANARVELISVELYSGPNAASGLVTRTDEYGKFAYSSVRNGQYRLRATSDGYLRKEYGETALDETGPPIRVNGREPVDLRVVLDPAPSITGRITDETGEALPDMLVTALRSTYDLRGNRLLEPAFSAQTDDRGSYRLYWIDPGEYYISAYLAADPFYAEPDRINGEPVPPLPGLAPTYYPGFPDPASGQIVKVGIGGEAVGIDFRMTRDPVLAQRLVSLRGSVLLSRTDLPGRSRVAVIRSGAAALAVEREESTVGDGLFEIGGVEPGEYMLIGQAIRLLAGGRETGREIGFQRILVNNRDIDNIEIVPSAGVHLDGRMNVYGVQRTGPAEAAAFRDAHVELHSTLPPVFPVMSSAVQADGSYTVDRFYPGADYLVSVSGLPGDYYLKAAKLGVMELLEGGSFRLDSTSRLGRNDVFEVTLGADGGNVKGTVFETGDDRVVDAATVVLVPDDRRRRRPDQYRKVVTDKIGNFTIRGIPPGNYTLVAWKRMEPNAYLNAAFFAPYEVHGTAVTIQPGANVPVGLRVVADR